MNERLVQFGTGLYGARPPAGSQIVASYAYGGGSDLLTGSRADRGQRLTLRPWDLAIIAEQ